MQDSIIICKFLTKAYPNSHPVVYLYVTGRVGTSKKAYDKAFNATIELFSPAYTRNFIEMEVKSFLDDKKKQYLKREILIKAPY